ncbi:terminal nucleotidyltransferase 5D-like [Chaetodon trifascialis]|uniref:terminal nucleotidyltransferase 5D-like n=1 Tax=Chaetodon trifascialis TaxID=109706 RepID=UPI0039963BBD
MMELQTEKRFHNLTLEQIQALDKVLTEVIPIHGRGNFPTLQVKAKDIIRVVKDRLIERDIQVKDIRLNGATASHVLVRDNGLGYRDLDIIFGVELPRQEDLQVIKEVVLGSLRDLLPCGVNRRKITCLTMKEAYVQKMVKVFNEHDRWSLISLSNNRAKTVGLRFVSSLRRQFEFSVDSFQIILDRMLESYWETERKQAGKLALNAGNLSKRDNEDENKEQEQSSVPREADIEKDSAMAASGGSGCQDRAVSVLEKELPQAEVEHVDGNQETQEVVELESINLQQEEEEADGIEDVHSEEDIVFDLCEENSGEKGQFHADYPLVSSPQTLFTDVRDKLMAHACLKLQNNEELSGTQASQPASVMHTETSAPQEKEHCDEMTQFKVDSVICRTDNNSNLQDSHLELSFPPPAKKTCSASQDIVPDYCPSPKLQRKMSRKMISKPEKWSLLTDLSDLTTQLFPPIEIPKPLQPKSPLQDSAQVHCSNVPASKPETLDTHKVPTFSPASTLQDGTGLNENVEQSVKPKHSKKPPDSDTQGHMCTAKVASEPQIREQTPELADAVPKSCGESSQAGPAEEPTITVEAECMYGDFEQAMDHLRHRLIATHNPEEIRGGGLLKYSDLLVRNFRPASETEIKSLERYMCSRFFIDFPDVSEQQRKIEAYLQCHFIGNEEASKYDYLMTLRRVIDESTVCLMGHERRQTLNMITVLALRVLGEQNAIPNTANVTCFYQPAPYMTEPIYSSYFITQAQPPLVYHPYPLHVHMQTGLV